jgi:hypothetical protein
MLRLEVVGLAPGHKNVFDGSLVRNAGVGEDELVDGGQVDVHVVVRPEQEPWRLESML